jgi:hypothetical protein
MDCMAGKNPIYYKLDNLTMNYLSMTRNSFSPILCTLRRCRAEHVPYGMC